MSNPFKKGDQVRCIKECLYGPRIGAIVTVDLPVGDHDIRPVGFRDAWLVGNFELVNDAPFKLANPKENSTVKKYTYNQIVAAIIDYKSSASSFVRAKLINNITESTARRGEQEVPNEKIVSAVYALGEVCDEGKQKFIKHLQLVEEVKKPEKLYITICVKPGTAFDASSNSDAVRRAYHRVQEVMRETGLGDATWSSAQVGVPDDMVSTWSEIYNRGAGKK